MQQLKTAEENIYLKFKKERENIINNFPQFFAFSDEQIEEGLKKLKTTKEDIISTGYGGFIKKSDKKAYLKMLEDGNKKLNDNLKNESFLYCALRYELSNHEFIITYDYEDTLSVFGLEYDKLTKKQLNILEKAKEDYLLNCED
jgi:hypothetical protein